MTQAFGARLHDAMAAHGPLCVGIDPHRALVESWGLSYDVAGLERFALTCVEAFAGRVAAVKPQSAFFEVFGSRGLAVLERVLTDLREAGTLTILDAKRGDIGSTMGAYAEAYLGPDAVAPPDALTVSPYLGYESLRPAIDLAEQTGRGLFVLALTSNPEGATVQHAVRDGRSVAASVVEGAAADNATARGRDRAGQHRTRHRCHGRPCRAGPRARPRECRDAGARAGLRCPGRHRRLARLDLRRGPWPGARGIEPRDPRRRSGPEPSRRPDGGGRRGAPAGLTLAPSSQELPRRVCRAA